MTQKQILNGDTDFAAMKKIKNVMANLISEFKNGENLKFEGKYQENFEQRLMMLEHDFDGLARRVLNLKFMYPTESSRNINYSDFLTEK